MKSFSIRHILIQADGQLCNCGTIPIVHALRVLGRLRSMRVLVIKKNTVHSPPCLHQGSDVFQEYTQASSLRSEGMPRERDERRWLCAPGMSGFLHQQLW